MKSLTGIEKTFERVYMDLLLKLMNFFRSHCLFRQRVISNSSLNRSYSLRLQLGKALNVDWSNANERSPA